jgi:hypothetical protein
MYSYCNNLILLSHLVALLFWDLVATIPFENTLDTFELTGDKLQELLEYSVSRSWEEDYFRGMYFLQQLFLDIPHPI